MQQQQQQDGDPPPPLDLVTSLQEATSRLNAMLFNYIGALQREAPPMAVKEEPLVAPPKSYDVQARRAAAAPGSGTASPCSFALAPRPYPAIETKLTHTRPPLPPLPFHHAGAGGADVEQPHGGAAGD